MTQTEALKLALEALEDRVSLMKWQIARDAVKEALAQPEQPSNQLDDINVVDMPKIGCVNHDCDKCKAQPEPVTTLDDLEQEIYENTRQFVSRDVMEWMLKRYYTTPPQRTWIGLTDDERTNIRSNVGEYTDFKRWDYAKRVQEATELALQEKNK